MNKSKKGALLMLLASLTGGAAYLVSDFGINAYEYITPANAIFWGGLGAVILTSPLYLLRKSTRNRIVKTIKNDRKTLLLVSVITSIGGILTKIKAK